MGDWGTFASNAVVSGNTNALRDVLDHYNKVKEFFNIETDAFVIAATLKYFGMSSVEDTPSKNCLPFNIHNYNSRRKREWLSKHVDNMIEQYVMDSVNPVSDLQRGQANQNQVNPQRQTFPCSFAGCSTIFIYKKCLENHERKVHGKVAAEQATAIPVSTTPSSIIDDIFTDEITEKKDEDKTKKEDNVFIYGCVHISLGLLLRDADDAVKEGDGERLVRLWRFLTLLFRMQGNNKYALAGLRLTASVKGLLTPKQAHRLTWNRFAATKPGPGKRISRDLRLEHVNKVSKEIIRSLGFPNINDQSIREATRATGITEKLLHQSNEDCGIAESNSGHCNKQKHPTFKIVLDQLVNRVKTFDYTPGRSYTAYANLKRNLFQDINKQQLHRWIKRHRTSWHKQMMHSYKLH